MVSLAPTVSQTPIDEPRNPLKNPFRLAQLVGLARTQCELGRMLSHAGKKAEAEAAFRRVVTLSEKLETDFAGQPEHRRELAQSHTSAAGQLSEARFHAEADRLYGWALQHHLALVRDDPQAKQSQEELAFFHVYLGGHHLWRTRRLKDADRSYQSAVEIFEKLALQFPEVLAYRTREADCRIRLGILAHRQGRTQQAKEHIRQGIQLAEKVAKQSPSDGESQFCLGYGYRWRAEVLRDVGSPQEVEESLVQSLAVFDKLVAEFPNNDMYLFEGSSTCRALMEHHFRTGRTDEGRRLYQRVVELSEEILANKHALANNVSWLHYSAWHLANRADGSPRAARLAVELAQKSVALRPDQASPYRVLGMVLSQQKKLDEAVAAYRKAIDIEPTSAPTHNELAWLLSTCADAKFRDPAQAVVHAKKAVELDSTNGAHVNTLGVAYYRTSDWKAAIASFEKSMELRKGGDSFDWFFLAMAHWQLGEKDKARDFYDRAVQWMNKNQPTNDELRRFREEAAELLGVSDNKE